MVALPPGHGLLVGVFFFGFVVLNGNGLNSPNTFLFASTKEGQQQPFLVLVANRTIVQPKYVFLT